MSRARPAAIICSVIAGAVLLLSGSQPWLQVATTLGEGMPRITASLAAATVAPGVIAGGFVLLAGGGALIVVRRIGAALVGGVLIATGAATAAVAVRFGVADHAQAAGAPHRALLAPPGALITAEPTPVWLVALLGALLGVGAGGLAIMGARHWRGLAARFRPLAPPPPALVPPVPPPSPAGPAEPMAADAAEVAALWDGQDAGRDPTETASATIRS